LQQIETIVTDSQGQGIMSFLTNNKQYTMEFFNSEDVLLFTKTVVIAPTQTLLLIQAEDEPLFPVILKKRVSVAFIPNGGTVSGKDFNLLAKILYDVNVSITDVNLIIQQNDQNLSDLNANHFIGASPFDTNISINIADLNLNDQWTFIIHVTTEDGNSLFFKSNFNFPRLIGGQDFLNGVIRGTFKTELGCQADDWFNVCLPTFIIAMFLAVVFSAAILATFGARNPNLALIIFMTLVGIFTYFFWVPALLFIGLIILASFALFGLAKVGK